MQQLICEGVCNPSLPTYDWFAERYAEALAGSGVNAELMAHIETQARQLKHTTHRGIGPTRYACLVCGTERRYGAKDWPTTRLSPVEASWSL